MISIIVPVYNTEKYLRKCIDSILAQTYRDIEVILVDDGSTDGSGAICDEYEKTDERVRVIHKENGGQATARNMALDEARGEYVGFVDSDDYISPSMYEELLSAASMNNADIAMCARYNVNEKTGEELASFCLDDKTVMNRTEALRRLCVYDSVDSSPCDKLIRKELFGSIRFPAGYICEDVDVIFRLFDKAERIVHIGEPMYYYLQRRGSTSHSSFSEKTKGLEIYHRRGYEFIKDTYPELKMEAEYFYFSRLLTLYNIIVVSNYKGKYRREIKGKIRQSYNLIKENPYIDKKSKKKFFLIKIGLYGLCRKVKDHIG